MIPFIVVRACNVNQWMEISFLQIQWIFNISKENFLYFVQYWYAVSLIKS